MQSVMTSTFVSNLVRNRPIHSLAKRSFMAAVRKGFDQDLELTQFKDLTPGPKDVLVRVRSAGINHADIRMIRDEHQVRLREPNVPGFEFAGEVIGMGEKAGESFKIGDRVLGLKRLETGAFAEMCTAHPNELYQIPHSMSYRLAASIPVAYGTALLALQRYAQVKEGENVVVLANHGSSGMAAIDLAINYFKANVLAGTSSQSKCDVMRSKGVMGTVDVASGGQKALIDALNRAELKEIDVLIDTVGGNGFVDALKLLKPTGRACTLGFSSGKIPSLSMDELSHMQVSVSGVWLGGFAYYYPSLYHDLIESVIKMIDEQYIEPYVGATYKLEDINEAIRLVQAHEVMGKVILEISS